MRVGNNPIVTAEEVAEKPKRVKVISASVEDAALSYLETCLSVPAHSADTRKDMPGLTRRAFVGLIDLLLIALMVSPAVAALQAASADWSKPRIVGLMVGITAATMFAYLTISIALTGRTLAMRLLRVRTIDERTGLIPTGGQSITRALGYIFSWLCLVSGSRSLSSTATIDRFTIAFPRQSSFVINFGVRRKHRGPGAAAALGWS